MDPIGLVEALRRVNRAIALAWGVVLLAVAAFVLVEIALRALDMRGLGGSDEIGGYAMAGVAAWGLAFALTERAHIRIEFAVRRLPSLARDLVDVSALASVAVVAATVAAYGWSVVGKSLARGSTANTPLETPLWMPQIVWWLGWGWFALCASLVALAAATLAVSRRSDALRALAGTDEGIAAPARRGEAATVGKAP